METIHPILIIKDTSLSEKYNRFIQEFCGTQNEGLIRVRDLTEISKINFSEIKPSREKKLSFKSKGANLVYPIIISIIEFENGQQAKNFLTFCDYVKDNIIQFKISDENDFRFINIFIANLERKEYDKSNQKFIREFENYCNENDLPLENTYNFLIDKYSEYNLDEVENSKTIVSQLFSVIKQLTSSHHIENYKLSHSRQSTSREAPSSVRYNSLGLASIGFQYEKVREGIKINRKNEFLDEITKGEHLTEDKKLEISKLSYSFITEQIQPIAERVRVNSFINSFHDLTIESVNDFRKEQERQIENLDSSEFDTQINLLQNRISREYNNLSKRLEFAEEESIQYSNKLSAQFKEELSRYVNNLMNRYDANLSIESGLIGIVNLVEKPTQHLVIEKGGDIYETIKEIKQKIEQENNFEPANIDESDGERTKILEQLNRINQRLSKQIEEANNYNLSKKILLNLLWVLAGLVIAILIIWKVPTFNFFDFDVIILSGKLKFSIWPIIIGLIIFSYKTFKHYRKLENIKKKLVPLGNKRIGLINSYVNTYHNYFEAIKSKLVLKHSEFALEKFISSIEKEKYQLNSFKQSLIRLKKKFDINNEDFTLEDDIFNKSIIGKKDINEFCKIHPLEFFQNNSVLKYYSEFKKGKTMFEPFLPKIKGTRIGVMSDEVIAAANKFDKIPVNQKEYRKLENNTALFLASDKEMDEIQYSDIKQGQLGDCYFLAALASIAHKEKDYIKNIISVNGDNHTVCFYDDDIIRYEIEIDNKFWMYQETDNPIYAKYGSSTENLKETWVMYVEKAWAKLNNMDYSDIVGSVSGSRKIDFSLTLTGKRAIKEHLNVKELKKETIDRLTEHLKNKPVVLYSLNRTVKESEKDLVVKHAYSLLKIDNRVCEIYNPHGSIINIPIEKLMYNFDTILYFDFEIDIDKHLLGLYSDFVIKNGINSLEKDMDNLIEDDLKTSFDNKSFEQLLPSFNYELNEEKVENFAELLISASTPNVYLPNLPAFKPQCQIIGKNELISSKIRQKLKDKGYKDDDYINIEQNLKKIGILQIRNNIRFENISNS